MRGGCPELRCCEGGTVDRIHERFRAEVRSTSGQQMNDNENLECRNRCRHRNEQCCVGNERQRNAEKLPERSCTIDFSRFIQFFGDAVHGRQIQNNRLADRPGDDHDHDRQKGARRGT